MVNMHSVYIVIIMALGMALLRSLPFFIFKDETPEYIKYLGDVLPQAIIAMLVVYCFKDYTYTQYPYALPAFIAGLSVVIVHYLKRNSILSILTGTIIYMILIQAVFV